MRNPHEVIMSMLRTEKGSFMEPMGKYTFWVMNDANKVEIRSAIETIYKVKVSSVNTQNVLGKRKRVRFEVGKRSDWKKAIVTLKKGEKIELPK